MFSRPMLFVLVLVASVGVPYVLLDKNLSQTAKAQFERWFGKGGVGEAGSQNVVLTAAGSPPTPLAPALPQSAAVEEAFRFELTPQWVTSRWPRVSTVLGDPEQLGLRVAYASGTRADDLAGSLTYYFDKHHKLERITFVGVTGDHRRVLSVLVGGYHLKSQPTTDVAHYVAGDAEKPTSSVLVRHLPVLRAEDSARAEVLVDLRRADVTGRKASDAAHESERIVLPSSYRRW